MSKHEPILALHPGGRVSYSCPCGWQGGVHPDIPPRRPPGSPPIYGEHPDPPYDEWRAHVRAARQAEVQP